MKKPIVAVHHASFRAGGARVLADIDWEIYPGDFWVVLGSNGAGKSTLVRGLWGGSQINRGAITYYIGKSSRPSADRIRRSIGYVSFELQQQFADAERLRQEERAYAGKEDEVTRVRDLLFPRTRRLSQTAIGLLARFGIHPDASAANFSTGEFRIVLIARALIKKPALLILDEPYDGLDAENRMLLGDTIARLPKDTAVVLVTHRFEEIPKRATHALLLLSGRILAKGEISAALTSKNVSRLYRTPMRVEQGREGYRLSYVLDHIPALPIARHLPSVQPVISMRNVSIVFNRRVVLDSFSWDVRQGECWGIIGPNGSGKSSLLSLITGDNPQVFGQDIRLFGRRRGPELSLWDIRKTIGVVNPVLPLHMIRSDTGIEVLSSGVYDSMGLYRKPDPETIARAYEICGLLGLSDLAQRPYGSLSTGQQRLVIIARALIKPPRLLILDEPCHGLDPAHRAKILTVIEGICGCGITVLMTTHHREELVPGLNYILTLGSHGVNARAFTREQFEKQLA